MVQCRLRLLALSAALAFAGCSSTHGDSYIKPGFDVSRIKRLAIVDGNNASYKADTRQVLIDSFQLEFLKRGWNIIERGNVQKAVDEMNFQHSDFASADDRKAIGHVLNADALAIINIASLGKEISITAKMLDTETGEVLWMGTGDGSVNSTMSTVTGALVGVAVGAAVGKNMGDNAGVGAAAGGIGGGLVGAGLSPSELENAKAVVAKVCEHLPLHL